MPYSLTQRMAGIKSQWGADKPSPASTGSISAEFARAKAENKRRYAEMMSIYNRAIARAQGGGLRRATTAQLKTGKTQAVGKEMQQMISGGLYGTTTAATAGRKYDIEVAAPTRLRLEDIMQQRISQAEVAKAGAIERRQDVYPDVGMYAQYAGQAAQAPAPAAISGGTDISDYMRRFQETQRSRITTQKPGAGYYGAY